MYTSERKNIKDAAVNKTVAVATYEVGAEIIAKALNYYFGDTYTRNEAVEMMHTNTSNSLKHLAEFFKKVDMDKEEIIEYLLEVSEELSAQALVVSMRDELNFDKPKND